MRESEVGGGSEQVSWSGGLRPGGWAWESFIPRSLFCKLVCNFYLLEKDCVAGG